MKVILALLLAGKLSKFLVTGGTMLLSIFTYALVFGWQYAVGLVGLLFFHEMGHYLAARQRGLNVGVPCFIPFVGAWIELKEQPMDAETEAYVGIAGPMLGSAAAFVCYLLARETNSPMLLALAYAGFMLNLFNLIPLSTAIAYTIFITIGDFIRFSGVRGVRRDIQDGGRPVFGDDESCAQGGVYPGARPRERICVWPRDCARHRLYAPGNRLRGT